MTDKETENLLLRNQINILDMRIARLKLDIEQKDKEIEELVEETKKTISEVFDRHLGLKEELDKHEQFIIDAAKHMFDVACDSCWDEWDYLMQEYEKRFPEDE